MLRQRIIAAGLAVLTLALCLAASAAGGGSASDPVISRSYLNDTLANKLLDGVEERIAARLDADGGAIRDREQAAARLTTRQGLLDAAADVVLEELQARGEFWYNARQARVLTLARGDVICGDTGTQVLLLEGSGEVYGNPVINLTAGYDAEVGSQTVLNSTYLLPGNDGSGVKITSQSARVSVDGRYKLLDAVRAPRYTDLAQALERMGLVRGASNGFELHRGATRAEALTMLIRLLAQENAALAGGKSHPFTDVDSWADAYVSYAYQKGYARGTSPTTFGASELTGANHYMTFLLRVLGYDDKAGDFSWDQAMDAAVRYQVLSQAERDRIASTPFTRDHMIYLSYYALFAKEKGGGATLLDRLVEQGAVSRQAADAAVAGVKRARP